MTPPKQSAIDRDSAARRRLLADREATPEPQPDETVTQRYALDPTLSQAENDSRRLLMIARDLDSQRKHIEDMEAALMCLPRIEDHLQRIADTQVAAEARKAKREELQATTAAEQLRVDRAAAAEVERARLVAATEQAKLNLEQSKLQLTLEQLKITSGVQAQAQTRSSNQRTIRYLAGTLALILTAIIGYLSGTGHPVTLNPPITPQEHHAPDPHPPSEAPPPP